MILVTIQIICQFHKGIVASTIPCCKILQINETKMLNQMCKSFVMWLHILSKKFYISDTVMAGFHLITSNFVIS